MDLGAGGLPGKPPCAMKPSQALPLLLLAFVFASCGGDEDSGGNSANGGGAGKGGSRSSGAQAGDGGGSSDAGEGAGGGSDGPGGSGPASGGEGAGGSSDGAGGNGAGSGGADAAGGSPSTDPCARPPAACGCDQRETDDVCYEFHGPIFTEASCTPSICPDGDLLEADCPPPTTGYCVGAVLARSELYYDDALVSVAEMDCVAGGGTWCTP